MGVGVGVAVGAVPSWAQADAMIAATMTITRIRIKLFRVISLTPESGLTCLRDSAIGLRNCMGHPPLMSTLNSYEHSQILRRDGSEAYNSYL